MNPIAKSGGKDAGMVKGPPWAHGMVPNLRQLPTCVFCASLIRQLMSGEFQFLCLCQPSVLCWSLSVLVGSLESPAISESWASGSFGALCRDRLAPLNASKPG